jgi:hypothetical protein
MILPVVLYRRETWSITRREERGLRLYENRVMRIFGPREKVAGGWRRLHNEELHNLYVNVKVKVKVNLSLCFN